MQTAYDLLGIRPDADDETIKTAFREAAKLHHPDRRPGDPHAAFRFRQIATANEILRDPERRADYDRWLALERRHMRSERARVIVSRAIDVVIFGVVLVMGSVWIVPVPRSELLDMLERAAALGTIEVVSVPPTARPDMAGKDGASARPEAVAEKAVEPSDPAAPPTVATAEVIATPGPAPDILPDDARLHRAPDPAASPVEDFHPEVAVTDAAGRLGSREARVDTRLGDARDAIADPDRALAVYDEAIRIIPNNPVLFHDRGLMWRRKGDLDRALADLDRAIRFGFSDANFYNDRGLIWLEKGRYHRAIADFERASKIDPSLADASINRDIALRRENEVAHGPADGDREAR
jgi:tetratricopeptide (TPR) repeat protein